MTSLELLQELIAIPSVNPDHTDNPAIANEYRMALFLSAWLSERGFAVEYDSVDEWRGNVIGRYGPAQPAYHLLLEAHLDTVGIDGMTIDPFAPVVKAGRCYGRGACDMKGALAAALTALDNAALLQRLATAGVAVTVAGAYGEETGNIGAERLATQGLAADGAIVLEPTGCTLVHAHKGALWTAITLQGAGGHGSDPTQGCNAILGMCELLPWLQGGWLDPIASAAESADGASWFGASGGTVNIGRIVGGNAINIIAPHCRVEVDRRLLPGESPDVLLARLDDQLQAHCVAGHATGYSVEVLKQGVAFATPPTAPLISDLAAAVRVAGGKAELTVASWHSDASALARTCKDVVVFGPGDIAQAHTRDEFIELSQLELGTKILRAYLEGLAAAP